MSSIAPTREEFDALLQHVRNSDNIKEMLECVQPYDNKSAFSSFIPNDKYLQTVHTQASALHKLLNVVQKLAVRQEFEGFTRQEVAEFISLFKEYLEPSFESVTVHTRTFGEEALRLLNHMAFDMKSTWQQWKP